MRVQQKWLVAPLLNMRIYAQLINFNKQQLLKIMKTNHHKILQAIIIFSLALYCTSIDCPPGFDSVPPGAPFGQCMILGCSRAIPNQPCNQQCLPGFIKTQSKSCQVIQCSSSSKTRCQSCERGYQLLLDDMNNQIRLCVPANCQSFDKISRICNKCALGYQLQKNGICALANCQQSISQSSQCLRCMSGYSLTPMQQGINVCLPQNCASYSKETYQCNQCLNLFIKQQSTGLCKSGVKNCINYSEISHLCYQCASGYKLVGLKNCLKEDKTCVQYGLQGCTTCTPPYRPLNGKCLPSNCVQYDKQNSALCKKCDVGYKLSSGPEKICEVQGCQSFDKERYRCSKCYDTHMAYYLPSYSIPTISVQRCVTKNCQIYHNKEYKCLRCNIEYDLVNGECVLKNCENPKAVYCSKCIDGWKINNRGNCVLFDCLEYDNQQKCKSCAPQKRMYKGTCLKDNCKTRKQDGTCAECLGELIVDPTYPKYCVTPYCKKVDQFSGDCLECFPNFKLNSKGICESASCQEFETKQGLSKCKKCQDGYQLKDNYCIPSKNYCSEFKLQQGKCTKCAEGYQLLSKSEKCSPTKCHEYQQKSAYAVCEHCNLGYLLENLANGVQKCNPLNCTKLDKGVCKQCAQGYSLLQDICLADNCQDFTEQGLCKGCSQGFRFNPATLTCQRLQCLQENKQTCLKCQDNFFPDTSNTNMNGLCRPYNCEDFKYINSQSIKCNKCVAGFISMPNMQKCVASDCANINPITGSCNECRPGFQLRKDGNCYFVRNNGYCPDKKYAAIDFSCQPMRAQKCLSANPGNTAQCYKCENGYFLKDGNCITYDHCPQQYRNMYLGCTKCDNGYQISKSGLCQSSVPNCILFDNNSGQCQKCDGGYQLVIYPTKICKLIPDYCLSIDPWGYCMQCRDPTRSLTPQKTCISYADKCVKYDPSTGYCSDCQKGNFLWTDYINPTSCRANPPNCDIVSNKGECMKCNNDFALSQGLCFPSIQYCVSYNRQKCTRCQANFFIQSSTGKCRQLPRYCDKVVLNTDGICEQCRAGYINANGTCVRKIEFCATYDTQTGRCATCINGYSLASSRMLCLMGYF